jgi:SSS family solute:Na+ symporter
VILFTALAGMSSVAYTDFVIGLVVTAGCLIALPAIVLRAGGWAAVRTALPPSHFTSLGTMSSLEVIGYFLPTFTLMIGNQTMYQKFFSARSERDARLSVVGWIAGTIVLETTIVVLAMVGGVLFRHEISSGELPPWGIIPYSARHGVAPAIGAVFLGAIFAKVISTGNNYLFSPATSVVHDVFERFITRSASDRMLLLISRLAVVLLGVIALAQAFQPSILARAVYAYDVYGAGITPAVVAAFFWKRTTTAGALSSILSGTAVAVIWRVGHLEDVTQRTFGHAVPMILPALTTSVACLIVISLMTPHPRDEQWRPFFRNQSD